MIAITGASGQLGQLVMRQLLKQLPATSLIAAVRDPETMTEFEKAGVQIREADYNRPETLTAAFAGAEKLLFISSSEIGQRLKQHQHVIDAALQAGVFLLTYTSLLHADTSPLMLAKEHVETEVYLKNSGIPHVLLRNGWYSENYTQGIAAALQYGELFGAAGEGKIASAARADYAEAAAVVLTQSEQAGKVYELAGDTAYTLAEFAAELSRQTGKDIQYHNLAEAEYRNMLLQAGLPPGLAAVVANADSAAAQGGLFGQEKQLSTLIGRPATPLSHSIAKALEH